MWPECRLGEGEGAVQGPGGAASPWEGIWAQDLTPAGDCRVKTASENCTAFF